MHLSTDFNFARGQEGQPAADLGVCADLQADFRLETGLLFGLLADFVVLLLFHGATIRLALLEYGLWIGTQDDGFLHIKLDGDKIQRLQLERELGAGFIKALTTTLNVGGKFWGRSYKPHRTGACTDSESARLRATTLLCSQTERAGFL